VLSTCRAQHQHRPPSIPLYAGWWQCGHCGTSLRGPVISVPQGMHEVHSQVADVRVHDAVEDRVHEMIQPVVLVK
jgi:hypothetical protein